MEHTRQALIAIGLRAFANEAHWFDCSGLLDIPFEIRAFGGELAARGLFQLPYPKVVFWWGDRFAGNEDAQEFAFTGRQLSVNGQPAFELRLHAKLTEGETMYLPEFYVMQGDGSIAYRPEIAAVEGFDKIHETNMILFRYVVQVVGALVSQDVDAVRGGPSDRQLRKATAKGREAGIVFHTLVLTAAFRAHVESIGGFKRNGPRLHWRRGHMRDLSGGTRQRLVPVAPTIVGSKKDGIVLKDYRMKAPACLN